MKSYSDRSFFSNPLTKYLRWMVSKASYQIKYWGSHLRIDYNAQILNTKFGKHNYVAWETNLANSIVGDYTYFADFCRINHLTIGKFCSVGPGVRIAPGMHPTYYVSTHPATYSKMQKIDASIAHDGNFIDFKRVVIGNDVWIGANSVIMDGVVIGDGAIVAANSVVTKDVGNYEIVGGVPAKHIKFRFSETQINALLEVKWWDKDDSWHKSNFRFFTDIEEFLSHK